MRKKIILYTSIIFAIGCMVMIFIFSSQNSVDTNYISKNFTTKLAGKLFVDFEKMDIYTSMFIVEQLNFFVRKLAHFFLYFILGFLAFGSVKIIVKKYSKALVSSLIICFTYATLDEIHQIYVPGRTPLVRDVVLDTAGGLCGAFFCFLVISAFIN